jgi:hypothetical protein
MFEIIHLDLYVNLILLKVPTSTWPPPLPFAADYVTSSTFRPERGIST